MVVHNSCQIFTAPNFAIPNPPTPPPPARYLQCPEGRGVFKEGAPALRTGDRPGNTTRKASCRCGGRVTRPEQSPCSPNFRRNFRRNLLEKSSISGPIPFYSEPGSGSGSSESSDFFNASGSCDTEQSITDCAHSLNPVLSARVLTTWAVWCSLSRAALSMCLADQGIPGVRCRRTTGGVPPAPSPHGPDLIA